MRYPDKLVASKSSWTETGSIPTRPTSRFDIKSLASFLQPGDVALAGFGEFK